MRLRKRDLTPDPMTGVPAYDFQFGHGAADYWQDVPDAPAQLVLERLNLWVGDWWLDLQEGTPYRTEILGRNTDASRDRAIRARVLATEGVIGITAYNAQLNRDTRSDVTQITLKTAYGNSPITTTVPAGADVRIYR